MTSNKSINVRIGELNGNFLTSWETVSFWRRTVMYGVESCSCSLHFVKRLLCSGRSKLHPLLTARANKYLELQLKFPEWGRVGISTRCTYYSVQTPAQFPKHTSDMLIQLASLFIFFAHFWVTKLKIRFCRIKYEEWIRMDIDGYTIVSDLTKN